jgi:hypothetical protein
MMDQFAVSDVVAGVYLGHPYIRSTMWESKLLDPREPTNRGCSWDHRPVPNRRLQRPALACLRPAAAQSAGPAAWLGLGPGHLPGKCRA